MLHFFGKSQKEETASLTEKPVVPEEFKEEKEIVFSKSVKAGKRMYYLDVKRDRRGELFLSVTESKRKSVTEDGQFIFEKHKIFLYKEDFTKFEDAFAEVMSFMREQMKEEGTLESPVATPEQPATPEAAAE